MAEAAAEVDDCTPGAAQEPRLVIVISGPTAVGKSDAALEVAEGLGLGSAEIVSADSVQVYRGLEIGSNQPTAADQERCATHLVGWLEPSSRGTAGEWTRRALGVISDIHQRGKVPVICGGSCMYLDWLVHGEPDGGKSEAEVLADVRQELQPFQECADWEGAVNLLAAVDPGRAAAITRNNWRILARQLELVRMPRKRKARGARDNFDFRSFFICPRMRHALFDRIDRRCVKMLNAGLLEEVASLLQSEAFDPDSPAGLAIGYRQVIEYLARPQPQDKDDAALGNFLRSFGSATRGYARSQAHWFSKDATFVWLPAEPGDPGDPARLGREILRLSRLPDAEFRAAVAPIDAESRRAWASQGGSGVAAPAAYRSFLDCPEQRRKALGEDLSKFLAIADACTRRVPPHLRRSVAAEAAEWRLELPKGRTYGKVFWHGRHRVWGWGNPLSKLHKQGFQVLEAQGWSAVEEGNASMLPVFSWCTRQAADFPAACLAGGGAADLELPLVRPFPQDFSDRLDDKGALTAHLDAAGFAYVQPPTWAAEDFLQQRGPGAEADQQLWFLKHNRGVKGNGVHVLRGADEVVQKLEELGKKGRRTFVVQQGVSPPALRDGRKWMLRVHALLHAAPQGEPPARLYCHKDMILVEYGQAFTPDARVRAAHISAAGQPKFWPKPTLLGCEPTAAQVRDLVARTFASVWNHLPLAPLSPPQAELCQVFGFDFIADAGGRVWLLEVNSYPALASGTMEHVDTHVYTNLVRDVLRLVVLPCIEGAPRELGGFVPLDVQRGVGRGAAAAAGEVEAVATASPANVAATLATQAKE